MSGPAGRDAGVQGRRRPGVPSRVLVAVLLLATACTSGSPAVPASDADAEGEITTAIPNTPKRLDPQWVTNVNQVAHTMMVFESLMTLDPTTLKPIPAAAKAPPAVSADGLTYTFTLRDGLTYSDGAPLTAKDFAYGFTRLCDPAFTGGYASSAYIIVGCAALSRMDPKRASASDLAAARSRLGLRANGDKDLVVTLTEPAAYFPMLAAIWISAPVRESDAAPAGDNYGTSAAGFIGNGPFKLVEWTTDRRFVFERNDRYRTPTKLKRWTKIVINDPTVAFAAYRNNELDFYDVAAADLPALERDAELRAQLVDAPGSSTQYLGFNVGRAPFSDLKVRQAFAKAFDREAWVRDVAKVGQAAYSLIPPGRVGHDPTDRFQAFDPAQARELLRSSTFFGKPELSTIRYAYRSDRPAQRLVGEWLRQQWKENLGVEITVEAVDLTLLSFQTSKPETTPDVRQFGWFEDYPDPQDWLTIMFHSSGQIAPTLAYADPTFDRLVRDADREVDPQRRAELYQQASRVLSADAPAAWLNWAQQKYLQKPWVKGVTPSANDYLHGIYRIADIYVTKGRK